MYHYTYLLQHKTEDKRCIGVRSCHCHPIQDDYWGSSKYIPDDVKNIHAKIILKVFATRDEAVQHEILLHRLNNVATNDVYYNRACQTSTKFDTTGVPFKHTEEHKQKLSRLLTGVPKTLSPEQRVALRKRLATYRTPEIRAKAAKALRENGSNKGIKNSQFRPWYITTKTITYLFTDITKNEKSIKDGHYKKYYADLQKKYNRTKKPIKTKQYGIIIAMGFLPQQYKI